MGESFGTAAQLQSLCKNLTGISFRETLRTGVSKENKMKNWS